jgi:thiamine biosynthesis lipoprotein
MVPSEKELDAALAASSITGLRLEDGGLRLESNRLELEEGGFGKGAALRDAVAAARTHGAVCAVLDFGGQVAVGGHCGGTTVGVADPDTRHVEVAALELEQGSAATSGLSERGIVVDGVRHGHILDPRDGRPARRWGAVTVIAADPFAADCVSTALYVMGPDVGARWASRQPDIEAIFVDTTGGVVRVRATAGLKGRLATSALSMIDWIPEVEPRQHGPPDSATGPG